MRAAATQRGIERADRMLSAYVVRMGAEAGLLDLAKTVKFESMHLLTREEIVRFGIDRRELVETPWTFENNSRSMVRKFVVQKNDKDNSYRLTQWRLICHGADRFELDFQRQAMPSAGFATVSISNGGPKPLYFVFPPVRLAGFEVWGLRMTQASVQLLAEQPQFDFAETSFASDGRRLAHPAKFSTEGLAAALASLTPTCPPSKGDGAKDLLQNDPDAKRHRAKRHDAAANRPARREIIRLALLFGASGVYMHLHETSAGRHPRPSPLRAHRPDARQCRHRLLGAGAGGHVERTVGGA